MYEDDKHKVPSLPFTIDIDLKDNVYKTDSNSMKSSDNNHKAEIDYCKIQLILKIARFNVSNSELIQDIKQIDKDIERTGYILEIIDEMTQVRMSHALRNILITFATFNQNLKSSNALGYTQGYLNLVHCQSNIL